MERFFTSFRRTDVPVARTVEPRRDAHLRPAREPRASSMPTFSFSLCGLRAFRAFFFVYFSPGKGSSPRVGPLVLKWRHSMALWPGGPSRPAGLRISGGEGQGRDFRLPTRFPLNQRGAGMPLRETAPKLPAEQYEKNFADITPPMTRRQAVIEATRCLFCFDAPCTKACPTHIDVPAFIKKITTGNLRGSAR